jgi:curved DNA-binding protein CbpA
MMVINAAYKVLKNSETRSSYDRKRKAVKADRGGRVSSSPSPSPPPSGNDKKTATVVEDEPVESFFDVLSELLSDVKNNNGRKALQDIDQFFNLDVQL